MCSPCDTEESDVIPGTDRKAPRVDTASVADHVSRRVLAFCKYLLVVHHASLSCKNAFVLWYISIGHSSCWAFIMQYQGSSVVSVGFKHMRTYSSSNGQLETIVSTSVWQSDPGACCTLVMPVCSA